MLITQRLSWTLQRLRNSRLRRRRTRRNVGGWYSESDIALVIPRQSDPLEDRTLLAGPGGVETDLTLWLKANVGVTAGGGTVSQWQDQSANSFAAVQATGANQPALVADSINFNPAVKFDGSNDSLTIAGGLLGGGSHDDLNVYVVNTTNAIKRSYLFREQASTGNVNAHLPWSNQSVFWDAGANSGAHRLAVSPWGGQLSQPYLWSLL